ncbi:MAG TPA: superoxide dismutase [Nevskiales bacterium]|nr:superoxide dismutase [Nevskiales bacterium]
MLYLPPPLPYRPDALEPYLSSETVEYHYAAHHKGYLRKLAELVDGTRFAGMPLEDIIARAPAGPIAGCATQAWNHAFYWRSMSPEGGGAPPAPLAAAIEQWFGSVDCFRQAFEKAGLGLFGSGWVWLVRESDGRLAISALSSPAASPLGKGRRPLLVCDLWEHAYYLDHRNQRMRYLHAFWDVVNWDFVAANLALPLPAYADRAPHPRPAAGRRRPVQPVLHMPA